MRRSITGVSQIGKLRGSLVLLDNFRVSFSPSVPLHEGKNGVVQSTPQVMNDVSEIQSQFEGVHDYVIDHENAICVLLERYGFGIVLPESVEVLVEAFPLTFRGRAWQLVLQLAPSG